MIELNRKYLKMPEIGKTFESKSVALETLESYVLTHINDFIDGESIIIRYLEKDVITSSIIVINIKNGSVSLSSETRIIESGEDTPPEDKDALWIVETDDPEPTPGITIDEALAKAVTLQGQVESLQNKVNDLTNMVNTLLYHMIYENAGGDFMLNSAKYAMENFNKREIPEDILKKYAKEYDVINGTAEDIFEWKLMVQIGQYFFIFEEYDKYIEPFYDTNKYEFLPFFFNRDGKRLTINYVINGTTESETLKITQTVDDTLVIYCTESGESEFIVTTIVDDGESGKTFSNEFKIRFEHEEEPTQVAKYVRHNIIKNAENFDTLSSHTNYVCVNEFVWCESDNGLYLKAKSSNGSIQLFKINGGGGTDVGGEPYSEFNEETSTLILDVEQQIANLVDEYGILDLTKLGIISEDGTLILRNKN